MPLGLREGSRPTGLERSVAVSYGPGKMRPPLCVVPKHDRETSRLPPDVLGLPRPVIEAGVPRSHSGIAQTSAKWECPPRSTAMRSTRTSRRRNRGASPAE